MAELWRYRGQEIDSVQLAFLREFIRTHPDSSRWKLSRQLCETLGWKQANGALRDMVCRGMLLMLQRAGEIDLPPVRRHIRGQCRTGRPRPEAVDRHCAVGYAAEVARPDWDPTGATHCRFETAEWAGLLDRLRRGHLPQSLSLNSLAQICSKTGHLRTSEDIWKD